MTIGDRTAGPLWRTALMALPERKPVGEGAAYGSAPAGTDQPRSRGEAGLMSGFQLDQALDSFAAEAPTGANLESSQFALPEQPIDGRGMHLH